MGEKRGSPFSAVEIVGIRHPTPRYPFREIAQEVGCRDGLPKVNTWPIFILPEGHGRKRNPQTPKRPKKDTARNRHGGWTRLDTTGHDPRVTAVSQLRETKKKHNGETQRQPEPGV